MKIHETISEYKWGKKFVVIELRKYGRYVT